MLNTNPSLLKDIDSPGKRVIGLDQLVPERKNGTSILLDKDERELVRKGDEVTKEEMW